MSDYVTSVELKKELSAQTEEITDLIKTFMVQVDERFNEVESRLDSLENRFDKLVNTIDGFVGRIDKYETELAARDHKIDRLEKWIEQLAKKTNTKLTV